MRRALEERLFVGGRDLAGAHSDALQPAEAGGERLVLHAFRMKLLIDVVVETGRAHAVDVAGARSLRDPVQHVRENQVVVHAGAEGRGGCEDNDRKPKESHWTDFDPPSKYILTICPTMPPP